MIITPAIIKYLAIIKRKKKKHDKIVLSTKTKLNSIEVFISDAGLYSTPILVTRNFIYVVLQAEAGHR